MPCVAQICTEGPGEPAPGGGGPAAVRGHHHVLPHEALRPGQEGPEAGRRGPRRARPHGRQVWQG